MTGSYMYDRRNVHQCRKGSARVLLSCRWPTRRDGKRRDGRVAIKLCGTRDDGEKHRREEISEARRLLGLPELRNMNNELGDDVTLVSIKRAFRLRVKEIHPDVLQSSDESMRKEQELEIQNVYKAYEILLEVEKRKSEDGENARLQRNGIDVFEDPREPAVFTFVNELRCIGRACPPTSCCVNLAPFHFQFADNTGAARCQNQRAITSLSEDDDYSIYRCINLCPRECISYCTEDQLNVLEETLREAITTGPWDRQALGERIDMFIAQANYNNGRFDLNCD